MAHLVSDVINVERIARRAAELRVTRALASTAHRPDAARVAAAAIAEDVADVVIAVADHGVEIGLILGADASGVVVLIRRRLIAVRIGGRVGVDDIQFVGDEDHPHVDFTLEDAVDTVHRRRHRGERARASLRVVVAGLPKAVDVLPGRGQRQTIAVQRAAGYDEGDFVS
ncbi:MAG: hypothetical protein JMDDDDMK_05616 [Acidobacteria bacterium]|nr:hypothetical protein [Acidobacteriota bacterium]